MLSRREERWVSMFTHHAYSGFAGEGMPPSGEIPGKLATPTAASRPFSKDGCGQLHCPNNHSNRLAKLSGLRGCFPKETRMD